MWLWCPLSRLGLCLKQLYKMWCANSVCAIECKMFNVNVIDLESYNSFHLFSSVDLYCFWKLLCGSVLFCRNFTTTANIFLYATASVCMRTCFLLHVREYVWVCVCECVCFFVCVCVLCTLLLLSACWLLLCVTVLLFCRYVYFARELLRELLLRCTI